MFVDYAEIEVAAGNGGRGIVSFHREKYVPKGGPDGGDGGNGGDLYVRANPNMSTLLDFRYKKKFQAPHGKSGGKNNMTGESGKPLYIDLPTGTIISDLDNSKVLADLNKDFLEVLIAKGGKGGKGNTRFKSSTNRTPRIAEDGQEGESFRLGLELKSIADVGLVGLPNAGKSTLLARLSAAKPKIADYPFTTKVPNLGIVRLPEFKSFVLADIPGLIEGAHQGKGMGVQFLRHIQRTKILVYLIDITTDDPEQDFKTLHEEMKCFDSELLKKPFLVVLNKIDLVDSELINSYKFGSGDLNICYISAATGKNIDALLKKIAAIL